MRGSGNASEVFTALFECNVVCGDGATAGDEECDDGNTVSGDGCSSTCHRGDLRRRRVDFGEECDDGNTADGDGCDADCLSRAAATAPPDPGEECDDGNRDGGDGCDEHCIDEMRQRRLSSPRARSATTATR